MIYVYTKNLLALSTTMALRYKSQRMLLDDYLVTSIIVYFRPNINAWQLCHTTNRLESRVKTTAMDACEKVHVRKFAKINRETGNDNR